MPPGFDGVSFLARSENRTRVLLALADGPATRRELADECGVERVTLGRALGAFERRGWVVREDDGYRVTALGRLVAEDLAGLLASTETAARLAPVVAWLPTDAFDFDLRRLADAELVLPTASEPLAPVRAGVDLMRAADHVRILAQAVTSETVAVQHEAAFERGQSSEVVLGAETLSAIRRNPDLRPRFAELVDAGHLTATVQDGTLPYTLGIYDDDEVGFGLVDAGNRPSGVVSTRDEAVVTWAIGEFERHRDRGRRLAAADLAGG